MKKYFTNNIEITIKEKDMKNIILDVNGINESVTFAIKVVIEHGIEVHRVFANNLPQGDHLSDAGARTSIKRCINMLNAKFGRVD